MLPGRYCQVKSIFAFNSSLSVSPVWSNSILKLEYCEKSLKFMSGLNMYARRNVTDFHSVDLLSKAPACPL